MGEKSAFRIGFFGFTVLGFATITAVIGSLSVFNGADKSQAYQVAMVIGAVFMLVMSQVFSANRAGTIQPWKEYHLPQVILLILMIAFMTLIMSQMFMYAAPAGIFYDDAHNVIKYEDGPPLGFLVFFGLIIVSGYIADKVVRYCLHSPDYDPVD